MNRVIVFVTICLGFILFFSSSSQVFAQYCICSNTICQPGCGETAVSCPADCGVPTYTISGTVFVDTNGNGVQNGGEPGYDSGVTQILTLSGAGSATDDTDGSGGYSFTTLAAGTYNVTLSVPSGYQATTTNPRNNIVLGPSTTVNFGIQPIPTPQCSGGAQSSPGTVNPGASASVSVSGCTDNEDPDDGTDPPPVEWEPPSGPPSPACNDGRDNDGDGLSDTNDPGCHTDGNPATPGTFEPTDDSEATPGTDLDPQCADNLDNDSDGLTDTNDPSCHSDNDPTDPTTYVPSDDSETTPSTACEDSALTNININATGSTATFTAPVCPASPLSCTLAVEVNGPGGSNTYSTVISVPSTYSITTNVRSVSDASSCTSSSGSAYDGANVNVTGGSVNTTQTTVSGTTVFACLPADTYDITLQVPSGYSVVGRTTSPGPSTNLLTNGIRTDLAPSQTATFCIALMVPWFQTDVGDVRFSNVSNTLPSGKYASTDVNYPGIYYSSATSGTYGSGSVSTKGWLVDDEYDFNADTQNRNGTLSYSYYKSRARKEGITIQTLPTCNASGNCTADLSAGVASGVYEVVGDLDLTAYTHTNGAKVIILVNGSATISTSGGISVPSTQGLFIVAASDDLTIAEGVGTTTLSSAASNIDGYYTAEDSIVIAGQGCPDTVTPDRRLNVGGALIANSLKPLASTGTGSIQNNRSICASSLDYPTLYVTSRTDFLTKLTDFYKTSYTKWREVNP